MGCVGICNQIVDLFFSFFYDLCFIFFMLCYFSFCLNESVSYLSSLKKVVNRYINKILVLLTWTLLSFLNLGGCLSVLENL